MENRINIKSDEISEILGTPPRWVVRWGITIIFIVIIVVFIGSIFFRYPDTVIAPVLITAENPPSVVLARASGKPEALFVKDGKWVNQGDTLGVIENPARFEDILLLSKQIVRNGNNNSFFNSFQSVSLVLGEIQPLYNNLSRAAAEYQTFEKQQFHKQKIEALIREVKQYEIYKKRLLNQSELVKKDIALTQKQFHRDSMLFSGGVISASDFEKSMAVLIAKQQALEGAYLNLSNTAITIERLKQTITDTQLEFESQRKKLKEELANTYSQLASGLASWEKNYLLIASSTGKLSFMSIWSKLQEVKVGDALFSITPESIGDVQARLVIPFDGAGKVKVGQRVNIKLNGYSYLEFGMIEGAVQSISSGYTENGFPALASLPKGAVTSYGFEIQLERELQGVAEITTEDLSLLQRLFSPLKHLYKSRVE
jgi:multidrug efflux pump subunit AcrA (membrane-fusion protein)